MQGPIGADRFDDMVGSAEGVGHDGYGYQLDGGDDPFTFGGLLGAAGEALSPAEPPPRPQQRGGRSEAYYRSAPREMELSETGRV